MPSWALHVGRVLCRVLGRLAQIRGLGSQEVPVEVLRELRDLWRKSQAIVRGRAQMCAIYFEMYQRKME